MRTSWWRGQRRRSIWARRARRRCWRARRPTPASPSLLLLALGRTCQSSTTWTLVYDNQCARITRDSVSPASIRVALDGFLVGRNDIEEQRTGVNRRWRCRPSPRFFVLRTDLCLCHSFSLSVVLFRCLCSQRRFKRPRTCHDHGILTIWTHCARSTVACCANSNQFLPSHRSA